MNKDEKLSSTTGVGGGLRFNQNKLRYDLQPKHAIREFTKVWTKGAEKYTVRDEGGNIIKSGDHNWENGFSWTSVIASLKRHLAAIESLEDYDSDTAELHSAHIMCNAAMLTEFYFTFPQGDDRRINFPVAKIGLDLDDVIVDFIGGWKTLFNLKDLPNAWYFDRDILHKFEDLKNKGTLDEFYLSLKPKVNPCDIPFEPHCYITSRPVDTSISEKWLDLHGFPARPVYTVKVNESKVDVARKAGITHFVDDKYENWSELNHNGICTYLFDAAHNQRYNVGHFRIKDLRRLEHIHA